jgi:hypothetical protein
MSRRDNLSFKPLANNGIFFVSHLKGQRLSARMGPETVMQDIGYALLHRHDVARPGGRNPFA